MPTMAEMQERVRLAAAVSDSYKATVINAALERAMKRILRDYNFPKSVKRAEIATVQGENSYAVPAGFKRPLEVRFTNTADNTWTKPLLRANGFRLPASSPLEDETYGRTYWLEGLTLRTDLAMPVSVATLKLVMWYQSQLLDVDTIAWMLEDLEDLIFSRATFLITSELRKEELAQLFAARVAEESTSIAIYANELEWEGMEMTMRAPSARRNERYPI